MSTVVPFTDKPLCPKCRAAQHHRYTCQLPPYDTQLRLECGRCHARWNMRTADAVEPGPDPAPTARAAS